MNAAVYEQATREYGPPYRLVAHGARVRVAPGDYPRLQWIAEINPYIVAPSAPSLGAMLVTRLNWHATLVAHAAMVCESLKGVALPPPAYQNVKDLEAVLRRIAYGARGPEPVIG